MAAIPVLANGGVHHRADAGAAPRYRNVPQPPLGVGFDEDVSFVGGWQRLPADEIAVHRQVLEKVVPFP